MDWRTLANLFLLYQQGHLLNTQQFVMRLSYLLPTNDSSLLTEVHTLDILTIPTDCSINISCDTYPAQNTWNTLIHTTHVQLLGLCQIWFLLLDSFWHFVNLDKLYLFFNSQLKCYHHSESFPEVGCTYQIYLYLYFI